MFNRPGIKTKEGLKTTGVYAICASLVTSVILPYLFPDTDADTLVVAAKAIQEMYRNSASNPMELGTAISDLLKLIAGGYILNGQRKTAQPPAADSQEAIIHRVAVKVLEELSRTEEQEPKK